MAKRRPCPSSYLNKRESFIIARGRHSLLHAQLMDALSVNSESGLALALLEVDGSHPHADLVSKCYQSEAYLDQAEKAFDAARALVAKSQIDADIASLEC